MQKLNYKAHLLFAILSIVIFFISKDSGFFWDNITFGYKMGNHLYEHGLFDFYFPDNFDPGHPPFLAFILALSWKILGKSLLTSHLVLIPFTYGLFVQLAIFVQQYTSKKSHLIASFIFLLADPTLSAQLVLISPEVIQVFFFLLAVNGILKNNYKLKTIGLFFLGIVTFRGILLCVGVFAFDILRHLYLEKKSIKEFISKNNILSYAIGAIPAISFIVYRLTVKGWLQTHPDSPWESLWHFVNLKEFIRNCIVLAHRYADFGRFVFFLFLIFMLFKSRKLFLKPKNKELLLLSITSVIAIVIVSLLAVNPFGHRYFIVSYLAFALLAFSLVLELKKGKRIMYTILLFGLITGNFLVYPKRMSQGWDASLAHMSYFQLRNQAIDYLKTNHIPIEKTAGFFPNAGKVDMTDLSGNMSVFPNFTDGTASYVLYSNTYNLEDREYDLLEENYILEKEFKSERVVIEILKHK